MLGFVYEIILIILGIAALPRLFYQYVFKHKYRNSLLKRLGSDFPIIDKKGRPLVWVHAVSLGETKAVSALVKIIKAELKNPVIVFSTVTETGYVEACRSIPADHHVYLPFDFGWVVKPIIKKTAPDIVILCESDFWHNFLSSSKKAGAKVVLVNGKLSKTSLQRYQKIPLLSKRLFDSVDLFCVQSELYRERFESLHVPSSKIIVTGNIKFDGEYSKLPQDQLLIWKKELGIQPNDPVLVVGSSHHPEEAQLLKVFQEVWKKFPTLKVMFVPRHPERFNEVAGVFQKYNVNYRRLSQKCGENENAPVILIDAMGLLRKCYQLADVAIVAGSYTAKVGGHNILEPSWFGVPVIFGPHMHQQPNLVELVREYGAGLQVSLEALPEELSALLGDSSKRQQFGQGGLRLAADVHGASAKTWGAVKSFIHK